MAIIRKFTAKQVQKMTKELVATLAYNGLSIKEAEMLLSTAHNHINKLKYKPINIALQKREEEPLSGILTQM